MISLKLWQKNLLGIVLGYLLGSIWPDGKWLYESFSSVYLNSLKMVAFPLVFFSLINAINSVSVTNNNNSRVVIRTLCYLTIFSLLAVMIGISSSAIFLNGGKIQQLSLSEIKNFHFDLSVIVPRNLFVHFINEEMQPLVLLALFIAYGSLRMHSYKKQFVLIVNIMTELMTKMLEVIIAFVPFGIAVIAAKFATTAEVKTILSLQNWLLALFTAYLLQLVVFGVVMKYIIHLSPIMFFKKSLEYQAFSFATGSSKASLPITSQLVRDKLGVSLEKSKLFLPLTTTINMIGLTIYLIVTILFIANISGIGFSISDYFLLILFVSIAPIGTASVSGGALIILPTILEVMGLPLESMALIIAIDPLINGIRTAINVTGDVVITLLIDIWDNSFNYKIFRSIK